MLLADIATGNTEAADVFFLVAVILFALEVILQVMASRGDGRGMGRFASVLLAGGLFCLAFGFLLL